MEKWISVLIHQSLKLFCLSWERGRHHHNHNLVFVTIFVRDLILQPPLLLNLPMLNISMLFKTLPNLTNFDILKFSKFWLTKALFLCLFVFSSTWRIVCKENLTKQSNSFFTFSSKLFSLQIQKYMLQILLMSPILKTAVTPTHPFFLKQVVGLDV